jgi:hypothetical protein
LPSWNLLTDVFGDPATRDLLSEAAAIEAAAVLSSIDRAELWEQTRNVGYPILPIRMIAAKGGPRPPHRADDRVR